MGREAALFWRKMESLAEEIENRVHPIIDRST